MWGRCGVRWGAGARGLARQGIRKLAVVSQGCSQAEPGPLPGLHLRSTGCWQQKPESSDKRDQYCQREDAISQLLQWWKIQVMSNINEVSALVLSTIRVLGAAILHGTKVSCLVLGNLQGAKLLTQATGLS